MIKKFTVQLLTQTNNFPTLETNCRNTALREVKRLKAILKDGDWLVFNTNNWRATRLRQFKERRENPLFN